MQHPLALPSGAHRLHARRLVRSLAAAERVAAAPRWLLRTLAALALAHAAGVTLTLAAVAPPPALSATVQRLDTVLLAALPQRFEPAFAPGLTAALGPSALLYGLLVMVALVSSLVARWRSVPVTAVTLALAALVAVELSWVAAYLPQRPPPIAAQGDLPVPEEWRAAWLATHPLRHVLVVSTLAAVAGGAWWVMSLPSQVVALAVAGSAATQLLARGRR
jgi:hypothetical protein